MARNLTDAIDGFVRNVRFLIHDRDPLFFSVIPCHSAVGVKTVKLPARSPNLNAYAERFVEDVKKLVETVISDSWSFLDLRL